MKQQVPTSPTLTPQTQSPADPQKQVRPRAFEPSSYTNCAGGKTATPWMIGCKQNRSQFSGKRRPQVLRKPIELSAKTIEPPGHLYFAKSKEQIMRIWNALVLLLVLSTPAVAQTVEVKAKPLTDADIQLIRQDVQGQKNQIVADTMNFTESEAATFWPVYKDYASAQQAIAAKRWSVVVDYAQNIDKMDDQKAKDLSQRMFAIDDEIQSLRKTYYPRFEKALGAKRAAKFYQVDNRLSLIVNLQLSSEIPLIP